MPYFEFLGCLPAQTASSCHLTPNKTVFFAVFRFNNLISLMRNDALAAFISDFPVNRYSKSRQAAI